MTAQPLHFSPDELEGFEQATITLAPEDDGPLQATLVRRALSDSERAQASAKPAVLYLHGFVDYFFQTHLADAVEEAGFVFYALDLRRYGRSLQPGNLPNQASEVDDYFVELDAACAYLLEHHDHIAGIIAHSTGCLVASHYLKRGKYGNDIACFVMNSPFFRFYLKPVDRFLTWTVAKAGPFLPKLRLPQTLGDAYSNTVHKSMQGEWDYNTEYKPLVGFPLYVGWFGMIRRAQAHVRKGLSLSTPVLCLHSSQSTPPTNKPRPEHFVSDIVLNVEDMKRIVPRVSSHSEFVEIPGAVHDVYLSQLPARTRAIEATLAFLKRWGQA